MREIKFRAWDSKEKKMLDWSFFYGVGMQVLSGHASRGNWEFMQYTGLKDKNGKPIFEGDIMHEEPTGNRGTVVFVNGGFACDITRPPLLLVYVYPSIFHQYEVIGNIYENPELLSQSEG